MFTAVNYGFNGSFKTDNKKKYKTKVLRKVTRMDRIDNKIINNSIKLEKYARKD